MPTLDGLKIVMIKLTKLKYFGLTVLLLLKCQDYLTLVAVVANLIAFAPQVNSSVCAAGL